MQCDFSRPITGTRSDSRVDAPSLARFAIQSVPDFDANTIITLAIGLGNVTGVSQQQTITAAHRLELLHQLKPAESSIAFLVNPTNPSFAAAETREVQSAANVLGVDLVVLNASSTGEIEAAFSTLVQRRAGAVLIGRRHFLYKSDRSIRRARGTPCRPCNVHLQRTSAGRR